MITWKAAFLRGMASGSLASLLSGAVLAVCGKIERGAPAGPLNGPSQWVWGERSAYRRRASWRTVVGYSIHHLVSIGWATIHEKHVASLTEGSRWPVRLAGSGVTSIVAFGVDYGVAKGRMQPGFEKQLSGTSLFLVYAAFAVGLALRGSMSRR